MTDQFISFFDANYSLDCDGIIRSKSTNRKVDTLKIFKDYATSALNMGLQSDVSKTDIDTYITQEVQRIRNEEATANSYDDTPKTSVEYVAAYIKKHQGKDWRIDSAFRMIERMKNGIPVNSTINDLSTAIYVQAIREGRQKRFKQGEIKAAIEELASVCSVQAVTEIASRIAYDAACIDKAEEFFKIIYSEWKIAQPYDVFKDVMMHFMWQCKRKLLGREVTWDLMVNFYGGTGLGKTTLVSRIGSVFRDFAIISSLAEVLDTERQVKKLSDCYYINLDELAVGQIVDSKFGNDTGSLNRAQKVAFKKLMSQKKARTRNMGGQSQSSQRYTFSFIASSNTHLADVMYDETTMRRYVELECQRSNIDDFSKIEYASSLISHAWKSIDENNDRGYLYPGSRSWAEVQEMRSKYYPSNTTTEAWVKEKGIVPCLMPARKPVMSLYSDYKLFCSQHGNQSKNYENWKKDIVHVIPGALAADGSISLKQIDAQTKAEPTMDTNELY